VKKRGTTPANNFYPQKRERKKKRRKKKDILFKQPEKRRLSRFLGRILPEA
jgi:hypothetical protein